MACGVQPTHLFYFSANLAAVLQFFFFFLTYGSLIAVYPNNTYLPKLVRSTDGGMEISALHPSIIDPSIYLSSVLRLKGSLGVGLTWAAAKFINATSNISFINLKSFIKYKEHYVVYVSVFLMACRCSSFYRFFFFSYRNDHCGRTGLLSLDNEGGGLRFESPSSGKTVQKWQELWTTGTSNSGRLTDALNTPRQTEVGWKVGWVPEVGVA